MNDRENTRDESAPQGRLPIPDFYPKWAGDPANPKGAVHDSGARVYRDYAGDYVVELEPGVFLTSPKAGVVRRFYCLRNALLAADRELEGGGV